MFIFYIYKILYDLKITKYYVYSRLFDLLDKGFIKISFQFIQKNQSWSKFESFLYKYFLSEKILLYKLINNQFYQTFILPTIIIFNPGKTNLYGLYA